MAREREQGRSPKRVAIVQSNYIPWKGYFDLIARVDEFVLFDDMQYTRRDWRNRNRLKTPNGPIWLTIPVEVKGRYFQKIKDTVVSDKQWKDRHWKTIVHNYTEARCFREFRDFFEGLYMGCESRFLTDINRCFLEATCDVLGIETKISTSMDYGVVDGKTERLVDLCLRSRATVYISGPSAREYIQADLFEQAGIELVFMDYSGYPEYEQVHPPFDHHVSIVDLVLNTGVCAREFMRF
jgi:hypothetical protein